MAVSQGQRLRKKAAKAVRRKAVVAQKLAEQRRELAISKPRHVDLAASPVAVCVMDGDVDAAGKATLTVARKLSLGRYAVSTFLLDLWCVGVEDAFFQVLESEDYEDMREDLLADATAIEPARARRLLIDAQAFGEANGFPPLEDFLDAARMLGDFEPGGEPFAMGDNGRPHYVVSPYANQRQSEDIIATLTEKLGPGGFDITYPLEEEPEEPDAEG